jgi:hypothetical protein
MLGSSDTSTLRAVHRLLEHYTPDGTLGRLLLGLSALGVATGIALAGLLSVLGGSLLEFVVGLAGIGLGVGALVVGLVTLWPLYLSLIGNVESPADYPTSRSRRTPGSVAATADAPLETSSDAHDDESPEAILKRRYAAGEIDDAEFERRLETVLSVESGDDWEDEPTRRVTRRRQEPETEQAGN